jgi:hypothetical protein
MSEKINDEIDGQREPLIELLVENHIRTKQILNGTSSDCIENSESITKLYQTVLKNQLQYLHKQEHNDQK